MVIINYLAKWMLRKVLMRTSIGYRFLLRKEHGITGPNGYPNAPWANAVLRSQEEVDSAVEQVRKLGLPLMSDLSKNWDSLAALNIILKNTCKDAKIFDAGAELYSVILPWLFLYGYKNLVGGNLVFDKKIKRGPIVYRRSDITRTGYSSNTFNAVTCLSVIEHGVDLRSFFKEMSRILKSNGMLIISMDYYETPIDTKGLSAYGVPIHIFTKEEVTKVLATAKEFGLVPVGPIDLTCSEKVVLWKKYELRFTFLTISLQKSKTTLKFL